MFELLPQIIIIVSIAGIIFIVARKIPSLSKIPEDIKVSDVSDSFKKKFKAPSFINKLWFKIKSFRYSEYSHKFLDFSEKVLRKLKFVFLKLENKLTDWAELLKEYSQKVKIRRQGIGVRINSDSEKNVESKIFHSSDVTSSIEDLDKLEEKCIAAIAKNPRDIKAYKELGSLYIKKNNVPDAREAFQQVLRLDHFDKDAEEQLRKLRIRKVRKI